jgi:hypothetical protein
MVTRHVAVPLHAPPKPVKIHPMFGRGVKSTTHPAPACCAHELHSMSNNPEAIAPPPVVLTVTR